MDKAEATMEDFAQSGAKYIQRMIDGGMDVTEDNLKLAKLAISGITNWTRLLGTKYARERALMTFARAVAKDEETMARYVEIALPDTGIIKALKAPAKAS